jgi:hypothetical protein
MPKGSTVNAIKRAFADTNPIEDHNRIRPANGRAGRSFGITLVPACRTTCTTTARRNAGRTKK